MKLACVVQRYGAAIAGGSEAHCRHLAERLAARHEVHVLTTCATDYVSWRNVLPAGWTTEGPVRVHRFPVARPRDRMAFAALCDRAFGPRHTVEDEDAWFVGSGPETPALIEYLRRHGRDYDLVLFWAFRYYHSRFGLPEVRERAVLVPTAEEDQTLAFKSLPAFFRLPRGYIFLTEEEQRMITALAGSTGPSVIIGTGLDPATPAQPSSIATLDIPRPFVLYVGRVDRNKGCDVLVDHFIRYRDRERRDVTLVLAGPVHDTLPSHQHVRVLGFVSDEAREALLDAAAALIMPSPYESLCIALLEGWNRARPALVNGRCAVLKGQVRRANGGLHYRTYHEFAAALSWLLDHQAEAREFGRQGLAYVDAEYRWPTVMGRVESLLEQVVTSR